MKTTPSNIHELAQRTKDQRGQRWAEENRAFIDSYTAYIERNGIFGEDQLDLDAPASRE